METVLTLCNTTRLKAEPSSDQAKCHDDGHVGRVVALSQDQYHTLRHHACCPTASWICVISSFVLLQNTQATTGHQRHRRHQRGVVAKFDLWFNILGRPSVQGPTCRAPRSLPHLILTAPRPPLYSESQRGLCQLPTALPSPFLLLDLCSKSGTECH